MKLTKKLETEIWQVYDTWLHSYLNGDVETYNSYLDDDYHFIGSATKEEFLNRKDTTKFFEDTGDQFAGKTEIRNESKIIEQFGELIFITHVFDAWFLHENEWNFYSRFRFSSILIENKDRWRFIYQHFSIPDPKTAEGETIGYDKINEENQELREAIQRRTTELEKKNRELEVETALERIRAQAVAMKESSDLLDIVVTMRNEFIKLGHEAHYFWHMMWLPSTYEKAMTSGDGSKIGFVMELPRHIHGDIPLLAKWEKSKKATVVYAMNTEEAIDYVDKMVNLGDFKNIDPQAPSHNDIRHIGGLTFIMARTSHGEIGYSLPGVIKNPPKEDVDILVKFAGAFDLAHQRFLDLQKAEKQAREVQIELALEKVRSRTMGMQRSDELRDTALLLFQQVEELGINSFACGFNIWDDDKKFATAWMAGKDRLQPPFRTNSNEDVYLLFHEAEKRGDALFVLEQEGKKLEDHYKYMVSIPEVKALAKAGLSFPTFQIIHCAYFSKGYLMFITHEPVPDAHDIFIRFAKVFEQTYTRFLDLQKAEAQARESEIELALERVRARTMAMQHSDELQEASFLLDQQVRALGIKTWGCAFNIYGENESTEWFGNEAGVLHTYKVPREGIFNDYFQKGQKGESLVIKEFKGKECVAHYEYMSSLPIIGDVLQTLKETNDGFPTYQIDHVVFFKYGYLLFITRESVPDAHDIFKRFAKVFEQTYTRFLDLQKAEKQARESEIELALERVRARTMAMQHSDELAETAALLFQQINDLGIETWTSGFNIWNKNDTSFIGYNPTPSGDITAPYHIPSTEDSFFKKIYEAKKSGEDFLVFEATGKSLAKTYRYMKTLPVVKDVLQGIEDSGMQLPKSQINHCPFFSHGFLLFITLESYPEAHDIFKRFAKVFEQTYTRFLDLQKAEAQARESQIELGLERVRARAMAMQHSDELSDLVATVLNELTKLDFSLTWCIINIINEADQSNMVWATNPEGGTEPESYYMKFEDYPFHHAMMKAWKEQKLKFVYVLEGKEKRIYDDYLYHETEFKRFSNKVKKANRALDKYVASFTFCNFGGLQTVGSEALSDENLDILERFGKVFDMTYTRFNDLQKAEAQAREAQIEAALEKVRSRSLAVHKSEEFKEVISIVFEKLKELQIPATAVGIGIKIEGSKDLDAYVCGENEEGLVITNYRLPYFNNKISKDLCNAYEKEADVFVGHYTKTVKNNFYKYVLDKTSEFKDLPEDILGMIFNSTSYTITMVTSEYVVFNINDFEGKKLTEHEIDILKRFLRVFNQAYIRFLDLQKAEAQAREAQIETALERVRSRSMAMHSSEELTEAGELLYQELSKLGIQNLTTGYTLFDETVTMGWNYGVNPSDGSIRHKPVGMNHTENKVMKAIAKSWKKQEPLLVIQLNEKETIKHQTFIAEESIGFPISKEKLLAISPERLVVHTFNFRQGYLLIVGGELLTVEQQEMVTRFAKVFQQTYTRFLDLQRAEAQMREAQIEMALEKVRSRTMAMQHSDELPEAANTLFLEVQELGIPAWSCGYNILSEDKKSSICNMSSEGELQDAFVLPLTKHKSLKPWHKAILNEEKFFVYGQKGKDLVAHYKYMESLPELKVTFEQFENAGIKLPTQQFNHLVRFNEGFLLFITYEEVPEAHDIFKRFGKVFEQTYTRFLDLKKAEAQARESEIELALERVRARTMAMQKSEEIGDVAFILFQQLKSLGGELWGTGFGFCKIDSDTDEFWFANEKGIMPQLLIPNTIDPAHKEMYEGWKNNLEFHSIEKGGKDLKAHYKYMLTVPDVQPIFQGMLDDGIAFPKWQKWHAAYFKYGYLLVITTETYENEDIFKRFAKVFEQTYTRFLDLQKAEEQAKEAQIETALERIRSRSMAMQKSSELLEAGELLWNEITKLGIDCFTSGYVLMDDMEDIGWNYTPNPSTGKILEQAIGIPHKQTPPMREIAASWKKQEPLCVVELTRKQTIAHQTFVAEKGINFPFSAKELVEISPKEIVIHTFNFKQGYLLIIGGEKLAKTQIDVMLRFTKVFQQTYTRFLDLKKAEAQTREAQIEAALERTRTQSMLMQHSNELDTTSKVFHNQLQLLGIDTEFSYVWLPDEAKNEHKFWVAWNSDKKRSPAIHSKAIVYPLDKTEPYTAACFKDWASGVSVHMHHIEPSEVKTFFTAWEELLKDAKKLNPTYFSKGLYYAEAFMKYGCFGINIKRPISNEEQQILQRFSIEFERTYTRFLDLQKAEAQAREAQIETALERIRSQSMGMQSTADFGNVTTEMFNQLRSFGEELFATGIVFCDKHDGHVEQWHSIPGAGMLSPMIVPVDLDYIHQYRYDQWKAGKALFSIEIPSDFIEQHFEDIFKLPSAQITLKDLESRNAPMPEPPPWEIDYGASFNHGYILVSSLKQIENTDILPRFAKVFEQTYTRFLDLQKAEVQAREAQIETALERVRSRGMAMHNSEELKGVVKEIFDQMANLNINADHAGIVVDFEPKNDFHFWVADNQDIPSKITVPYLDLPWDRLFTEAKKKGKDFFKMQLNFEEKNSFYKKLLPHIKGLTKKAKDFYLSCPGLAASTVLQKDIGLYIENFSGISFSDEENDILMRFGKVFQQAYTRFLDLKKAEEQAKEAQIEMALEKVRSRTMAMQKSDELAETSVIVFKQLLELGIAPNRLFIGIVKGKSSQIECWATNEDGSKLANKFIADASQNKTIKRMLAGWKKNKQSLTIDLIGKELKDYFEYLSTEMNIPFIHGLEQKRRVQTVAYFSGGFIGMASPEDQPAETTQLLERFASVFNLTYTRFNDLKVAEAQSKKAEEDLIKLQAAKKSAEKSLSELQQTQKQLIQSEKMASLGELTAGIAHEIQNPLNFVNNFSEVSKELLDEMLEEIEAGDMEEVRAIMADVIQNLDKINHHGKRADGIVKGMLQHSRASGNKKEATDINLLTDEYFRLAYHGLRAKDKSFNANLETDYDENLKTFDVIPQDIGRVILNLFTNAFYAVDEKSSSAKASEGKKYAPTVSVSTKKLKDKVTISVKDNGNGIPKHIIDKIFQPFFTTKPTGKGTGLGLSMSYDIIKAHEGDLKVETKEGEGTYFIIELPLKS
ncbi:ATP-binding protein [Winogradskyella schleiferi]|uniref:ATP-binding protein n=1 Tax=Winogradskyella schleiferi TaxID=2686078 RepID=UPI0015BC7200|nr:ATP-binding protein [Winogradskyella schleiferi]